MLKNSMETKGSIRTIDCALLTNFNKDLILQSCGIDDFHQKRFSIGQMYDNANDNDDDGFFSVGSK